MFSKGPPLALPIDAPNPNPRMPLAQSLSTTRKHFQQPQSSLWMVQPPQQLPPNSQQQLPLALGYGSPTTDYFRHTEATPDKCLALARKPAASASAGIGIILPPSPTPTHKFQAAHQVMVGDLGWFTLLSRELNMTMRMPSRVNCGDAQALARALPAFSHLHALHLGSNHIADAGAAAVVQACSHHDTITSLYLHCNRLTSHSAAAIGDALERGGCRLQLLQLAGNMLGDAGARRIARALHWQTCLLSLDMSHNGIGDDGCEALAAALHCNHTLQDLSLRGNTVTDASVGALLTALGVNTALVAVDLCDTQCSPRALQLLEELIIVKK